MLIGIIYGAPLFIGSAIVGYIISAVVGLGCVAGIIAGLGTFIFGAALYTAE